MNNYEDFETQYMVALENIYTNGYYSVNERTGMGTKRLPAISFRVDLQKEFPILRTKQVFWKTSMREILWIWQKMSNNIKDLNGKVWNEWADENGSIGKGYGYQINKPVKINIGSFDKPDYREYPSQTAFILGYLNEFPNGRQAKTTLWNVAELSEMHLVPCVHSTDWNIIDGKLNLILQQRSGDMPYGVPFNTTQYAMLQTMFARHLGVEPGILLHTIADAHIYENQYDGVLTQLNRWGLLKFPHLLDTSSNATILSDVILELSDVESCSVEEFNEIIPKFVIDETITSFWDMNEFNCKVIDYKHLGKIDFGEIAV